MIKFGKIEAKPTMDGAKVTIPFEQKMPGGFGYSGTASETVIEVKLYSKTDGSTAVHTYVNGRMR